MQGQALYVHSARQTARTIVVRAVLRHDLPYKGLHLLRRYAAIPLDQFIQRVHKYKDLNALTSYALRELIKGAYIKVPDKSSSNRRHFL